MPPNFPPARCSDSFDVLAFTGEARGDPGAERRWADTMGKVHPPTFSERSDESEVRQSPGVGLKGQGRSP